MKVMKLQSPATPTEPVTHQDFGSAIPEATVNATTDGPSSSLSHFREERLKMSAQTAGAFFPLVAFPEPMYSSRFVVPRCKWTQQPFIT